MDTFVKQRDLLLIYVLLRSRWEKNSKGSVKQKGVII